MYNRIVKGIILDYFFLCGIGIMVCGSARGQTWDYVSEFSIAANPNAVWSYGWTNTLGSTFTLLPSTASVAGGVPARVGAPNIYIWVGANNTGSVIFDGAFTYTPPYQGLIQPAWPNSSNKSVVRWTAPADGVYQVDAEFSGISSFTGGGGNGTSVDVHVMVDSVSVFNGTVNGFIGSDYVSGFPPHTQPPLGDPSYRQQEYSSVMTLTTGQTVDAVVGDGGTAGGDITGLKFTISQTYYKPSADAGPDQTYNSLPLLVSLDGSGSSDPGEAPLTYHWQQASGPAVELSNPNIVNPTFVPTEFGIYVFELVVSNALYSSDPDITGIVISENNYAPVADAGFSRYAAADPIILDGSRSYDPDGYGDLEFQWRQTFGPVLNISGADTATPVISGFIPTGSIQDAEFELTVSDGISASLPTSVIVTIVPGYSSNTSTMVLENPPFDTNKPTIVFYWGGNCYSGGISPAPLNGSEWRANANLINFPCYTPDQWPTSITCYPGSIAPGELTSAYSQTEVTYYQIANKLLVYLSSVAPDYERPIQMIGASTGSQPVLSGANYLNQTYQDPRYAINRLTILDPICIAGIVPDRVAAFNDNPVNGEQCWVDHYYNEGWGAFQVPEALNVVVQENLPQHDPHHNTAIYWYLNSLDPTKWTTEMYRDGIVAGGYLSLVGPGKNLQLFTGPAGGITYFFEVIWDGVLDGQGIMVNPSSLGMLNDTVYAGRLPEPITLLDQAPGGTLIHNWQGYLSSEASQYVAQYELLYGPKRNQVNQVILGPTSNPPEYLQDLADVPYSPTYWTIRSQDTWGSSIFADPLIIPQPTVLAGDFDSDNDVDINDLFYIIQGWLSDGLPFITCGQVNQLDLNHDCIIDIADFSIFSQHWLEEL